MMHVYCHCADCRNARGAEFSSIVMFPKESLVVSKGADKVISYKKVFCERNFCSVCGTPVYNNPPAPFNAIFPSLIKTDFKFAPTMHILYKEKIMSVKDGLPKYAGMFSIRFI